MQTFSVLMLAVSLFVSFSVGAAEIAQDRMLVVDGKRVFVLGLYENPKDDAVLKQATAAGFNLVHTAPEKVQLDRLQQHGTNAWVNTGACIDLSQDRPARETQMRSMVDTVASHPALWVWEVPDEALWNCWYGPTLWRRGAEQSELRAKIDALTDKDLVGKLRAQLDEVNRLFHRGEIVASEQTADGIWEALGLKQPHPESSLARSAEAAATMCKGFLDGRELLRQLDPKHPVWMNHAPRNRLADLAAFGRAADIAGCDIYPVPEYRGGHSDLADRSLSCVGAYTDIMQASIPGKPVWMVLQGFGWADIQPDSSEEEKKINRRPTFAESRFMAFDAIVHGARGILYWGTAYIEKDSALWNDLLKLIRELAELQPVLSAPDSALKVDVEVGPGWGSADRGVRVLAKDVDGKTWFLIVNEFTDPLPYTLKGLSSLDGTRYEDPIDQRSVQVANGQISLTIGAHGVQVLAPSKG